MTVLSQNNNFNDSTQPAIKIRLKEIFLYIYIQLYPSSLNFLMETMPMNHNHLLEPYIQPESTID